MTLGTDGTSGKTEGRRPAGASGHSIPSRDPRIIPSSRNPPERTRDARPLRLLAPSSDQGAGPSLHLEPEHRCRGQAEYTRRHRSKAFGHGRPVDLPTRRHPAKSVDPRPQHCRLRKQMAALTGQHLPMQRPRVAARSRAMILAKLPLFRCMAARPMPSGHYVPRSHSGSSH